MSRPTRPVFSLGDKMGHGFQNIRQAHAETEALRSRLEEAVEKSTSDDVSFVVFGSLARSEFTQGSDVDWTLLLDGQSDPAHFDAALNVERSLSTMGLKDPGREGTFGGLAFSHELLHRIGGSEDSNRNTTQRVLLLLESLPIGNASAYNRVVRNVLSRYINEDWGLSTGLSPAAVPRFLQNDLARYWRTMAVDFAYKRRHRGEKGWALRTVKLRLSRKLIYAAGLVACFSTQLEHISAGAVNPLDSRTRVVEHLQLRLALTPLDVIAQLLNTYPSLRASGIKAILAYDAFLGILADSEKRQHLEQLEPQESASDPVYEEARDLGHAFQEGLDAIFFGEHEELTKLTRIYGVF